ncbi:MAG: hypothetical protein PHW04_04930 [Candidatus Wallbacteria bacterium]|nr:hypothetical protein [Candidatus Wallbacteria bacterium]
MKIMMDLLPIQYKCEKRDYLAIALLVFTVAAGSTLTLLVFLSMHTYYKVLESSIQSDVARMESDLSSSNQQADGLKERLSAISFDAEGQLHLNDEIEAFNRIGKGFAWSRFFNRLEQAIPKRVWIKAFDITSLPHFTMVCESADQILPIVFEQQMMLDSKFFKNVFLGDTVLDKKNMAIVFRMSFDYCGE